MDDQYLYTDQFCIKVLDLTQIEKAEMNQTVNPKLVKWAKIFKAETMEELEKLTSGEAVFQEMVFTIKQLSEDEKIRMQCEAREDYERRLASEFHAGVEHEKVNTEKERQRADLAEAELQKLRTILSERGISEEISD